MVTELTYRRPAIDPAFKLDFQALFGKHAPALIGACLKRKAHYGEAGGRLLAGHSAEECLSDLYWIGIKLRGNRGATWFSARNTAYWITCLDRCCKKLWRGDCEAKRSVSEEGPAMVALIERAGAGDEIGSLALDRLQPWLDHALALACGDFPSSWVARCKLVGRLAAPIDWADGAAFAQGLQVHPITWRCFQAPPTPDDLLLSAAPLSSRPKLERAARTWIRASLAAYYAAFAQRYPGAAPRAFVRWLVEGTSAAERLTFFRPDPISLDAPIAFHNGEDADKTAYDLIADMNPGNDPLASYITHEELREECTLPTAAARCVLGVLLERIETLAARTASTNAGTAPRPAPTLPDLVFLACVAAKLGVLQLLAVPAGLAQALRLLDRALAEGAYADQGGILLPLDAGRPLNYHQVYAYLCSEYALRSAYPKLAAKLQKWAATTEGQKAGEDSLRIARARQRFASALLDPPGRHNLPARMAEACSLTTNSDETATSAETASHLDMIKTAIGWLSEARLQTPPLPGAPAAVDDNMEVKQNV